MESSSEKYIRSGGIRSQLGLHKFQLMESRFKERNSPLMPVYTLLAEEKRNTCARLRGERESAADEKRGLKGNYNLLTRCDLCARRSPGPAVLASTSTRRPSSSSGRR